MRKLFRARLLVFIVFMLTGCPPGAIKEGLKDVSIFIYSERNIDGEMGAMGVNLSDGPKWIGTPELIDAFQGYAEEGAPLRASFQSIDVICKVPAKIALYAERFFYGRMRLVRCEAGEAIQLEELNLGSDGAQSMYIVMDEYDDARHEIPEENTTSLGIPTKLGLNLEPLIDRVEDDAESSIESADDVEDVKHIDADVYLDTWGHFFSFMDSWLAGEERGDYDLGEGFGRVQIVDGTEPPDWPDEWGNLPTSFYKEPVLVVALEFDLDPEWWAWDYEVRIWWYFHVDDSASSTNPWELSLWGVVHWVEEGTQDQNISDGLSAGISMMSSAEYRDEYPYVSGSPPRDKLEKTGKDIAQGIISEYLDGVIEAARERGLIGPDAFREEDIESLAMFNIENIYWAFGEPKSCIIGTPIGSLPFWPKWTNYPPVIVLRRADE